MSYMPNTIVPDDLLKTNRPPTNEERARIQASIAPSNPRLASIAEEISGIQSQIREMESQIKEMASKIQRLSDEEAAILEASAAHKRALSPFRNLPDDVIREICVACLKARVNPTMNCMDVPLILGQISSQFRHIALTTPILWASVHIVIQTSPYTQTNVFRRRSVGVREWLDRSGGLPLYIFLNETHQFLGQEDNSDVSDELFETLFSYSSRWKNIRLDLGTLARPLARLAALTATDVPILQSLALNFNSDTSMFHNGTILQVPTLRHLGLVTRQQDVARFSVNWSNIIFLRLDGTSWTPENAVTSVAHILKQTTSIIFCVLNMRKVRETSYHGDIFLPSLRVLSMTETYPSTEHQVEGLLKFVDAPMLDTLSLGYTPLTNSLVALFQRSANLRELNFVYDDLECSGLMELLAHCPSLKSLSIKRPDNVYMPWLRGMYDQCRLPSYDPFLQAFVRDDDAQCLCPRLERFEFDGKMNVSVDTLRQFFGRKRGVGSNLSSWKRVSVAVTSMSHDAATRTEMIKIFKEQKAAGIIVSSLFWLDEI